MVRMPDEATGGAWFDEEAGYRVRPYTITRGRTRPATDTFDLITNVVADRDADLSQLEPEATAIHDLCLHRALSVAEIAASLDLPVSVVRVLLGDMLDISAVATRAPLAVPDTPDIETVEAVLHGLRELL